MQELYDTIIDLRAACEKERLARWELESSESVSAIDKEIAFLNEQLAAKQAERKDILSIVPDSTPLLEDAKKALFEAMLASGKDVFGDAKLKYSNSRSVNKETLLGILDGDLSLFYRFANVTLKSVEQAAKENADNRYLDCIETVSTPVGVEVTS